MTDDKENRTLEATRQSLDQSVGKMPDDLSAGLAAARQRALSAGVNANSKTESALETSDDGANVVKMRQPFDRNRIVWGGAVAASCAALALTLALRQPDSDEFLLFDANDGVVFEETQDSIFLLAEMDETEWGLVQELEFALWLSEFGDEASDADFPG